jgi:hypothetical protein
MQTAIFLDSTTVPAACSLTCEQLSWLLLQTDALMSCRTSTDQNRINNYPYTSAMNCYQEVTRVIVAYFSECYILKLLHLKVTPVVRTPQQKTTQSVLALGIAAIKIHRY